MKKTLSRLFMLMLCVFVFVGCEIQTDERVNGSTASEENSSLISENSGEKTTSEEQSSSNSESTSASDTEYQSFWIDESTSDSSTEFETDEIVMGEITSEYVVVDGDNYSIILPSSKEKLDVNKSYVTYLWRVDDDMLKEAEIYLSQFYDGSGIYLSIDNEGNLCLCVEIIVDIDPPNVIVDDDGNVISGGCNVDHKHVFHIKPITH